MELSVLIIIFKYILIVKNYYIKQSTSTFTLVAIENQILLKVCDFGFKNPYSGYRSSHDMEDEYVDFEEVE